ncbi:substrate-binding domain-containing protein [Paenibacillus harenae]|uniref:Ribose transport system substrate-binding protein n=1 Tax=Paenibacillus harenae TaxID=306543 RepID=A0ABT9TXV3_PAEHA|nr:substrate-binding domain-containing protein [Paenibacillus harenae]MDQ0112186.1 ribose transport system substrate-binding protein [Paenibacillus harenae]
MSNRLWNVGIVLLFLLLAALLLQFFSSSATIRKLAEPSVNDGLESAGRKHIVLISQERDNPFWLAIAEGARAAAESLGMELEYTGPLRINQGEQTQLLKKAIAAKADAILIQGLGDSSSYKEWIDRANKRHIPIIAIDTDEPGSQRIAYVGTDNFKAGRQMGELVAARTTEEGLIGVLLGNEQAANQQLRLAGLQAALKGQPRLRIAEVRSSNISRLEAQQQTEDLLASQPNIRILVGFSALDGAGMMEAASRLGRGDIQIFAFDDLDITMEGIRGGRIEASIVQQPRKMGAQAIELLSNHWQGEPISQEQFTDTFVLDADALTAGSPAEERLNR